MRAVGLSVQEVVDGLAGQVQPTSDLRRSHLPLAGLPDDHSRLVAQPAALVGEVDAPLGDRFEAFVELLIVHTVKLLDAKAGSKYLGSAIAVPPHRLASAGGVAPEVKL